jgi:hypothetical protein
MRKQQRAEWRQRALAEVDAALETCAKCETTERPEECCDCETASFRERAKAVIRLIEYCDAVEAERDDMAEDSWSQLWQACGSDKDGKKTIDNMCMSTYEGACVTFEGLGWLEEVNSRIYRVTKPGWD